MQNQCVEASPFSLSGPYQQPLSTVEAGLLYIREGWAVVPLISREYEYISRGSKRCRTPFHGRLDNPLRTESQVHAFLTKHPKANIGIKTGPSSGVFVLDIDKPPFDSFMDVPLPLTKTVQTKWGRHFYFQYPTNFMIPTITPFSRGDLLGGFYESYAVVPPSIHASGHQYIWEDFSVPVAPAPPELIEIIMKEGPRNKKPNVRRYTKALLNTKIRSVLALVGR